MTEIIPSSSDSSVALMYITYVDWISREMRQTAFLVDADLVEALKILGNFHPRMKQRPEDFAPVLRKRHPMRGGSREVRLPVAVVTLKQTDDPVSLASDMALFLDMASVAAKFVPKSPKNGFQSDCRFENWTVQPIEEVGARVEVEVLERELESKKLSGESVGVDGMSVSVPKLSLSEINALRMRHGMSLLKPEGPDQKAEDAADKILGTIQKLTPSKKSEQVENSTSVEKP